MSFYLAMRPDLVPYRRAKRDRHTGEKGGGREGREGTEGSREEKSEGVGKEERKEREEEKERETETEEEFNEGFQIDYSQPKKKKKLCAERVRGKKRCSKNNILLTQLNARKGISRDEQAANDKHKPSCRWMDG